MNVLMTTLLGPGEGRHFHKEPPPLLPSVLLVLEVVERVRNPLSVSKAGRLQPLGQ